MRKVTVSSFALFTHKTLSMPHANPAQRALQTLVFGLRTINFSQCMQFEVKRGSSRKHYYYIVN
jgi:hypothetical protein